MNTSEQVKCQCGVRGVQECPGAWEPGCDLGTNEEFVQAVEPSPELEALRGEEPGFVRMPRNVDEAACMVNLGRMWMEVNAPQFLKPGAPVDGRPVAWVRYCSDGGIEGPIMDNDSRMENVRRKSGAWTPLGVMGTGPKPAQDPVAYLYHDAASAAQADPMLHSTLLVMARDRRPNCRNETPLYADPSQDALPNAELVAALKANHQWHQDHDDHDGYPESELCELNIAALTNAGVKLDDEAAPPPRRRRKPSTSRPLSPC